MKRLLLVAAGALLLLAACKNNGPMAGNGPITTGDDCIVQTSAGKIMGYNDAGIYTFKGVPYARADRFLPPVDPDPWEGVRKTQVYGPQARQSQNMNWGGQPSDYDFGFQFKNEKSSEDCQRLNVMEPVIAESILESQTWLTNAMNTLREKCIVGITVNADHCYEMVKNSIGIVTALNPYIGYKASTKVAKEALETGGSVYDLVLEHGLMTKEKLDEALDPAAMTQPHELLK